MKARLYKDTKGEWRWRVTSRNGRVLADSGEGYVRRKDCKGIFQKLFPTMTLVYENGQH